MRSLSHYVFLNRLVQVACNTQSSFEVRRSTVKVIRSTYCVQSEPVNYWRLQRQDYHSLLLPFISAQFPPNFLYSLYSFPFVFLPFFRSLFPSLSPPIPLCLPEFMNSSLVLPPHWFDETGVLDQQCIQIHLSPAGHIHARMIIECQNSS